MTTLDYFNECLRGGYNNTPDYISWKIINKIMYLQCSREKEDWRKNFNFLPIKLFLETESIIVPAGFYEMAFGLLQTIAENEINGFIGYSHGGAGAAILSGITGKHAKVFGCPNFIFNPSKKQKTLFYNLEIYNNPSDIVGFLPPVYTKAGKVTILKDVSTQGTDTFLEYASGHSPDRYRQNLEGV